MHVCYFAHSWLSDWNHGNAHFLRGLASALVRRGHTVRCYEDIAAGGGGWSLAHLFQEPGGSAAVAQVRSAFPELDIRLYGRNPTVPAPALAAWPLVTEWAGELRHADVVIAHEWSDPDLLDWLRQMRRQFSFRLLLHDTHHRLFSQPAQILALQPAACDAVLAFGESLRREYQTALGVRRVYTLHEAADTVRFHPLPGRAKTSDIAWIGNWGDDERTLELAEFLLQPAAQTRCASHAQWRAHGVRYPPAAAAGLQAAGIAYAGYLPNLEVPSTYASSRIAVHIPRQFYAGVLAGIPTIRVFEALACGMPLLSAPWHDAEQLFAAGSDYWMASNGKEMAALVMQLLAQPWQQMELGRRAAATVRSRHTCAHRACELEAICRDLD